MKKVILIFLTTLLVAMSPVTAKDYYKGDQIPVVFSNATSDTLQGKIVGVEGVDLDGPGRKVHKYRVKVDGDFFEVRVRQDSQISIEQASTSDLFETGYFQEDTRVVINDAGILGIKTEYISTTINPWERLVFEGRSVSKDAKDVGSRFEHKLVFEGRINIFVPLAWSWQKIPAPRQLRLAPEYGRVFNMEQKYENGKTTVFLRWYKPSWSDLPVRVTESDSSYILKAYGRNYAGVIADIEYRCGNAKNSAEFTITSAMEESGFPFLDTENPKIFTYECYSTAVSDEVVSIVELEFMKPIGYRMWLQNQ